MSDSSSTSSGGSSGSVKSLTSASPKKLAQRIQRKLSIEQSESLPVANHKAACETMVELRTHLLDGARLDEGGKMCLTCAGIAVCRRIACERELPDAMDQLKTTLALLYVLVVISSGKPAAPTGSTRDDDESMEVEESDAAAESILEVYSKRCVADSLYDTSTSSWGDSVHKPGALCRAALVEAHSKGSSMEMDDIATLGACFFRASAAAMATALFNACSPPGDDFLTLGTASFLAKANDGKTERLASIADVAESEAGQTVLRDMILSFTLPRSVVGVRRTCLLTRDANAKATAEYTEILNAAHEAAMRAANYCWNEDTNEVHRMSALLAGIAVLLARNAQSIRKDDAFDGRVDMPFLETTAPKPGVARLALLESTGEWIVYAISASTGRPDVQLRAAGFEGLCQATLSFVKYLQL